MTRESMAQEVKRIRKKYGFTQQVLADVLGLSPVTISRSETGAPTSKVVENLIVAADSPHFIVSCINRYLAEAENNRLAGESYNARSVEQMRYALVAIQEAEGEPDCVAEYVVNTHGDTPDSERCAGARYVPIGACVTEERGAAAEGTMRQEDSGVVPAAVPPPDGESGDVDAILQTIEECLGVAELALAAWREIEQDGIATQYGVIGIIEDEIALAQNKQHAKHYCAFIKKSCEDLYETKKRLERLAEGASASPTEVSKISGSVCQAQKLLQTLQKHYSFAYFDRAGGANF